MLIAKTIRCIAAAKLAALGELRRAPSLQRRLNCAISSTAAPSRHKPPRRLQVFGAVRERSRAARSRSFLRRPPRGGFPMSNAEVSAEYRQRAFVAWTKSEAFRLAHRDAGQNKPLYLDHPQLEGFEVRQTVRRGEDAVA
jgi:hypothetical protein